MLATWAGRQARASPRRRTGGASRLTVRCMGTEPSPTPRTEYKQHTASTTPNPCRLPALLARLCDTARRVASSISAYVRP